MKTKPLLFLKTVTRHRSLYSLLLLLCTSLFLNGCVLIRYEPLPRPTVPPAPQPTPQEYPAPAPAPSTPKPTVPTQPVEQPVTRPVQPEPGYKPVTGAAASLYQQAKDYSSRGQYKQAELALERALRIEPQNGYYWYSLAKVNYRLNRPSKAVQFCLKSKSLAGRDKRLVELNDWLIAKTKMN